MRPTILLPLALLVAPAFAGPLDEKLTAAEPCRDLPQISETESVTLERATVTVLPETAEMTLAGRLACRSGAESLMAGDASTHIDARVELALATCKATSARVRLSEFGGSLGPLVEALAAELARVLEDEVADAAEDACRDLLD